MPKNTAVGLIFANMHDDALREGTAMRSMGSMPFGGRYRLIDFVLSNMVNAGVTKVGVITKKNYQSLMDHLGSGKAWDLSRKHEGLYFLPPLSSDDAKYQGRLASLADVLPFLHHSKEEHVVLADCHTITSMDYGKLLDAHVKSGADVTMVYGRGTVPPLNDIPVIRADDAGRVTDLLIGNISDGNACYGTGVYVVRKDWLLRTVAEASARNLHHFERDILQKYLSEIALFGYEATSLILPVYNRESYYRANLALLVGDVRSELFPKSRPVYTKVHDYPPVQYGLHADVTNSLVGDGCHLDGTVKNCIVFRGVNVARDAVVENSVLMQGVTVTAGAALKNIVADKNAVFRAGVSLQGAENYPVYIAKNTII